jgi:hypothetical protein
MLELQTRFDGEDIARLKIYYDTDKQQYKHKANCGMCGEFCFCVCYKTLEDAYYGYDEGVWCDKCTLKENLCEEQSLLEDIIKIIAKSDDPNRLEDIYDYVLGLLDDDEIKEALLEVQVDYDPSDCTGEVCK